MCDVQVFRRDGTWRRPENADPDAAVQVMMWGADAADGTPGEFRAETMRVRDLPLATGVTVGQAGQAGVSVWLASSHTAGTSISSGGGGYGTGGAGGSGRVALPGLVVVITERP